MELEEDFSDAAEFVQEDDTLPEQGISDDEVERKIAEEHAKYREAQAKRQEEVRASRPWSSTPMESPRPEQQKERERERQARASSSAEGPPPESNRSEYEPPPRPYLALAAQASGSNLSHLVTPAAAASLSRPHSAEPRSSSTSGAYHQPLGALPSRLSSSGVARGGVPTLQGIEEEGTEAAMSSRQASGTGRQYGSGGAAAASLWASHAVDEVAEDGEAEEAPEVAEEESTSDAGERVDPDPEQQQEREGQWGTGLAAEASRASSSRQRGAAQGAGDEGEEQEQSRGASYGARDGDAEEVPEDGEVDEEQEGDGHSAAGRRSDAGSRLGGASGDLSRAQRSGAYDDAGVRAGSRSGGWGSAAASGAGGGSTSHRSYQQSAAASGSMAMRGFVEPLTYDNSYDGAGAVQAEGAHSQRGAADDEEGEAKGPQQEDDGYGDDSFEEVPDDNEESEEPEDRPPPAAASEASYGGRQPDRPTSSLSAVRPLSRTGHAASPEDQEEEDDRELFARAAAAAAAVRRPAAGGTTAPPPAPPPAPELLPPQEFAMQLLKHDIEVLPAHHRATAEVAGKGRRPTSARPVGAGLAAFGYLGFHVPPDTLTAPTGPAYRTSANGSPGQRTSSPGRVKSNSGQEGYPGAGANLAGGPSLTTVRPDGATAAGEGEQRPTSAPHVRPDGGAGGSPGATVAAEMSNTQFLGAARELRAGKPPARPASAVRGTGRHSTGGGAQASVSASPRDLGALLEDKSMSVLGDDEASAANNRIKFDVWLDALSGKAADQQQQQQTSEGGASAASSRRSSRPMTAPASGRRRPVSARPAPATGTLNAAVYGTPHTAAVPRPLARPMSAQPHHMRPVSASRSGHATPVYDTGSLLPEATVPVTIHPHGSPMSAAGGGTAAVDVAGVTVSVYVADTLKRIVEANRWLQQLGVTVKRYRLKDRLSNMTVQLVEELPVHSYGREYEDSTSGQGEDGGGNGHYATVLTVLKELTLKQFLSGHARLKQQVRALRLASTPPLPAGSAPPPAGGSLGLSVAGGAHGISMSGGQGAGSGAGRTRPYSAGPGGSHSRPTSASAAHYVSAGGAAALADGPFVGTAAAVPHPTGGLRSVYPGPTPARTSLPARPSSANPAYGRTPIMYGGGAPPGGPPAPGTYSAATASYGNSRAGQPQGPQHHTVPTTLPAKSAWGAAPATNGANGAPLPYMVRSVSAHARSGGHACAPGAASYFEEDEDEEVVVVEADPMADVTRSVRSQLGSAAEYCQARRAEIARLRNMPLA